MRRREPHSMMTVKGVAVGDVKQEGPVMSEHFHAVVWIDHREARVFHFNAEDVAKLVIHPDNKHVHLHHKANSIGAGHAAEDQKFLAAVAEAMGASKEVLVTGPGAAKTELVKYISKHAPRQLDTIKGVETSDHPTDGQIVAHARKYFGALDLTTPQKA
jgi:stalled ribosome rescue protein Dom34